MRRARGLSGPVFENTAASVERENISLAQHHAMDLAESLNVFVLRAASRDLKSRWRHDSDRMAEGPSCRVTVHRRNGGKAVSPSGEQGL